MWNMYEMIACRISVYGMSVCGMNICGMNMLGMSASGMCKERVHLACLV